MLGNPKKIERIDATGPAETGWGVGMWSGNRPGDASLLAIASSERIC